MMSERTGSVVRMTRRGLVSLVVGLFLSLGVVGIERAHAITPPESFIEKLGKETVAVLSKTGSNDQERIRDVSKLLDQAADLPLISRLVLGRSWRTATAEQRQQYVKLFRDYALNSLARRFNGYTGGERFKITGSKKLDDTDSLVTTDIALPNRPRPANVDWRVRREDGQFKIIDVVAEGVSMVITNRAQFDSIVSREGMDGLLKQMRKWAGTQAS